MVGKIMRRHYVMAGVLQGTRESDIPPLLLAAIIINTNKPLIPCKILERKCIRETKSCVLNIFLKPLEIKMTIADMTSALEPWESEALKISQTYKNRTHKVNLGFNPESLQSNSRSFRYREERK